VILHHESAGDGRVLLMGGSLGTTLRMWDGQLPLTERLRLIRYDHRGHGGSPVPPPPYEIADLGRDVLVLMDALGLERASYCGLSIGGMVGIWLGVHAPERIDRLVLICTAAHLPPPEFWQQRAAAVLEGRSTAVIADAVVERWLTPDFATAHSELCADLRAMVAGTDAVGYAASCGAIERMDQREELGKVTAPTLVISGRDDPATPADQQRLIAERIAGARHEIVAPAAHLAAVQQPEAVNRLILEHLS
jgi:3-oxoadipate enol-lactonase